MSKMTPVRVLGLAVALLGVACARLAPTPPRSAASHEPCIALLLPAPPGAERYRLPVARAFDGTVDWDLLAARLARYQAVLIGEQHDRYDHHLNQLETLCRLHRRGAALALGLEAFAQPYQGALDDFVAGRIELAALLERTEYYDRWRFDHRLYLPLLTFARDHAIPLVALNVPHEVTQRLRSAGAAPRSAADRGYFPFGLGTPGPAYRARLAAHFETHPGAGGAGDLERFIRVQWLWDEAMGQRAARYLLDRPGRILVVIAGSGHLAYADALPDRLHHAVQSAGRTVAAARVLQSAGGSGPGGGAAPAPTHSGAVPPEHDVRLESEPLELPPAGRLGVLLEDGEGGPAVTSLPEGSAAGAAGIRVGDRLVGIGAAPVRSYRQVRLALAERRPGDRIEVAVRRPGEEEALRFAVILR